MSGPKNKFNDSNMIAYRFLIEMCLNNQGEPIIMTNHIFGINVITTNYIYSVA